MQELTPQEAQARLNSGALLIDVREQDEYDEVHAQPAQLLPLSELESRYQELPQDKELILICRSGARSARALQFLQSKGYSQLVNLKGGTEAWVNSDLPNIKAGQ